MEISKAFSSYISDLTLNGNSLIVNLGIFLVIGFILGFISKHYGKYLFLTLLGGFFAIYIGYYYNLLSIDFFTLDSIKLDFLNTVKHISNNKLSNDYIISTAIGFIFALLFS